MSGTDPQDAFLTDRRDGVLTITFNRPGQGNATPTSAVPLLTDIFRAARLDSRVRAILIAARGRHFCTGGNIDTFASEIARGREALVAAFSARMANVSKLVEAVIGFDRPIVTAVHGTVAGAGLLYALAADVVIADDTAVFMFAHQRMGLSPDGAVSWLLPRVVGLRQSRRLLFGAKRVAVEESVRLGLVSELVAAPALLEAEAIKQATALAVAPQRAISYAKRLTADAMQNSLADHLAAENLAIIDCVADPDFAEGVQSFLEKRPVRFPSACADTKPDGI